MFQVARKYLPPSLQDFKTSRQSHHFVKNLQIVSRRISQSLFGLFQGGWLIIVPFLGMSRKAL